MYAVGLCYSPIRFCVTNRNKKITLNKRLNFDGLLFTHILL